MEFEARKIIKRPHQATKWTKEVLAGALVGLRENNEPINSRYLQVNHNNIYQAISGYPGGWRRIVIEAGLDPAEEIAKREG